MNPVRPVALVLVALLAAGCVSKKDFVQKSEEANRFAADLAKERRRSGELAIRAAQLDARLGETERNLAATVKDRDSLRAALAESRTEAARLAGQLAEATDQRDTLTRQLDIAQSAGSQKDVNIQRLTYQYDDLIKDLNRQKGDLSKRLTDLGAELAAADSRANGLQAERDALAAERFRLEARARSLAADLTTAQADLVKARGALSDTQVELTAARQRLADTQAELTSTRRSLGETQAQLEERERRLKEATATYDTLVSDLKGEIAEGQVKITQLRDRLTVNLVDKILFDSGSTAINPRGQQVLKKVAEVLRPIADKRIQIEGHTDNVPISPSLKARFPTNWELSVARATVVARFLEDQGGLDPSRLAATGFGEHHPVGPNDTPEGRAQNRRIEIVLVPTVTETAQR